MTTTWRETRKTRLMKYGRNEHERKKGRAEDFRGDRADYIPAGRSERQFDFRQACATGKKSRIKEKPSVSCRGFGRLRVGSGL